ncbi:MAG: hypothetical protein IJS20_07185 [Bacteroidales bacterium]|nr:hypothetical protein [Bacteroidales bacterium]
MKTRITLLLISLIGINPLYLSADNDQGLKYEDLLPNFNQITPEAASLGKYGSIGCSEYTGVPDIKVPLFDIKSGDLSVPVYLYYDASGIKVEQEATFVGLGWNLSYGGCITHIVNGKDDFYSSTLTRPEKYVRVRDSLLFWTPLGVDYNKLGIRKDVFVRFGWGLPMIGIDGSFSAGKYYAEETGPDTDDVMMDIADGYFVPDVFQASFCGHSVLFTFDNDTKEVVVIGDDASKYKIECVQEKNSWLWPKEIIITDAQGIVYKFVAYCEYGANKDSYFLDSVTDVNGRDWVKYTYSYREDQLPQCSMGAFFQTVGGVPEPEKACPVAACPVTERMRSTFIERHSSWTFGHAEMKKVYPRSIETPQETVSFEYEERTDVINGLRIKRLTKTSKNGNKTTNRVDLQYGSFKEEYYGGLSTEEVSGGTTTNALPHERLKLTGLQIDGKTYSFSYDESHPLPYRTALAQDYWGYYNGVMNKRDFCATPKFKIRGEILEEIPSVGRANRYCSPEYCKTGVLNRIDYPTGGYNLFDYEVNRFDNTDHYYYMDARDVGYFTHEKTKHTTTLETVHAVAALNDSQNKYEGTFTLETDNDVEISYGLRRETRFDQVEVSLGGPGTSMHIYLPTDSVFIGKDTIIHLEAGTYTLKASVPHKDSQYNTLAVITANLVEWEDQPFPLVPEEKQASMGGGLRVKSISKYSGGENDRFLGGTEYEYTGGQLLIPTNYAKHMIIDEEVLHVYEVPTAYGGTTYQWRDCYVQGSFHHTGSSAQFLSICSIGTPTVGYSSVAQHVINADGSREKSVITDYHNGGYALAESNVFYHPFNPGRNGKPQRTVVMSANGDTLSSTRYEYGKEKGRCIIFPQCLKNYLWKPLIPRRWFSLSAYVKSNIWHYLTRKVETQYEGGKPMKPVVTDYTYNNDNYQTSKSTRRQGTQVIEDRYQYSVDGVAAGSDLLINKHVLSRLTGTRQYLNGNLTGGAQLDFREHDTIQHDRIPVVKMYRNILPSGKMDTVLTVVDYDERGNIREYVTKNGTHTTILWSHNYQYPVMQIVGATYEDVKRAYHAISVIGKQKTISLSMMKTLHNMFSAIKEGELQVTAYVYDPWYGVSDIIQPNGKVMHYDKDSQGRLSKILEDSATGPVVQRFFYHYRNR